EGIRFLAYGRTSFRLRAKFGDWGEIATEALSDAESLRRFSPAFGYGLQPEGCCLIWQELREGARSHGYPDVLLLDLGELLHAVPWEGRTAKLMEHLFAEGEAGSRILAEIQKITTGEILDLARSVPSPGPAHNAAANSVEDRLSLLLAGSCLWPRPLAVAPENAGLSSRPTFDQMDRAQAALPPGLRNGAGWAVIVRERYASALGVQLVFHPDGSASHADITEAQNLGQKILNAAMRIEGQPEEKLVAALFTSSSRTGAEDCKTLLKRLLALDDAAQGNYDPMQNEMDALPPGELQHWLQHYLTTTLRTDPVAASVSHYLLKGALNGR